MAAVSNSTRDVVVEIYDAYARGDLAHVASFIDDDIEWIIEAPIQIFQFAGARKGRAAVLEAMQGIGQKYELKSYVPEIIVVEGDRAAVMSNTSFIQRATGRVIRVRLANFLRFRNGRVIEFREFANTFDLVEQTLGREFDL